MDSASSSNGETDEAALARKHAHAETLKRIVIVLLVTFLLLTTLFSAYGIVLVRGTQQAGSPIQKRLIENTGQIKNNTIEIKRNTALTKTLAERINSCTNPHGSCARRSAQATVAAIIQIKNDTRETVILTLTCQERLHATDPKVLTACVNRLRTP